MSARPTFSLFDPCVTWSLENIQHELQAALEPDKEEEEMKQTEKIQEDQWNRVIKK